MNIRNLAGAVAALLLAVAAHGAEYFVYAGTYTNGASRGIYGYRFDAHSGKLKPLGLMAAVSNPTFLLEHADHRFLYAVSEDAANSVSAFLIDPKSGKLSPLNKASSKGASPCHLALDRSGRWLAVANFGSGSVAVLPLRKDGGLGDAQSVMQPAKPEDPKLKPHALCVLFSLDNRFLLVADYGVDRIYAYRFDAETGSLKPADTPFTAVAPGAGVRRLAFHPNGRVLFAANESQPGVTAYRYDPSDAAISEIQTVPMPPTTRASTGGAAEVVVNAAGNMVYASNRGLDSLALFVVDPVRFTLSVLEFTPMIGLAPRCFALDPTGAFLVVGNQESRNLTVYSVHPHSGQLRPVGSPRGNIDRPVSLVFVQGLRP